MKELANEKLYIKEEFNTMKKAKKIALLALCAVLLVGASVAGTLAYLTSKTETLKNTFTIGKVKITLDEAKTNQYGVKVDKDGKELSEGAVDHRISTGGNAYTLVPGTEYTKDPTVHVEANSEDSWIFVKVSNGISAFEAVSDTSESYKTIADQITANGWTVLTGQEGVYYKSYTKSDMKTDLKVFESFRIADNANTVTGWESIGETTTVEVTAYAIQKTGFTTASAAWTEVSKSAETTGE